MHVLLCISFDILFHCVVVVDDFIFLMVSSNIAAVSFSCIMVNLPDCMLLSSLCLKHDKMCSTCSCVTKRCVNDFCIVGIFMKKH